MHHSSQAGQCSKQFACKLCDDNWSVEITPKKKSVREQATCLTPFFYHDDDDDDDDEKSVISLIL